MRRRAGNLRECKMINVKERDHLGDIEVEQWEILK
jgi:hypothetical protein